MTDKYKSAILKHERCRKDIVQLTNDIGELSLPPCDDKGVYNGTKCGDYRGEPFPGTTCLERYWQRNRDDIAEEGCPPFNQEAESGILCPNCTEIDKLVIKRRVAKQKFGIAKRRIGQLARGLTKQSQKMG